MIQIVNRQVYDDEASYHVVKVLGNDGVSSVVMLERSEEGNGGRAIQTELLRNLGVSDLREGRKETMAIQFNACTFKK